MATLKSNGQCLVEMIATKRWTDGADGDPMTLTQTVTYRAMSSGYTLKRIETVTDYAIGGTPSRSTSGWKRAGKIKAHLMQNKAALVNAMQEWADQLREKGWDAEIS